MMIKINNRYFDKFGNVIYCSDEIIEKIYEGDDFLNLVYFSSDGIEKFNYLMKKQGIDLEIKTEKNTELIDEKKIKELTEDWMMPEEYKNINIEKWFFGKKLNDKEIQRVKYELEYFKRNNLYDFLRFMIYLVDFMKKNNIVWGVGRGSSVASYCLYLIGIHRINSLEYDLDFHEFIPK